MTVETTNRKQTFSGGQGSLTFSFRTLVSNPEYIKTLVKLISTGAETELTYGSDYTVSVNSDGVGGTVTVLPTYSTSYNYVVYRETTATQGDDYDDFNTFPANTLENSLDRAIMIAQEQQEETARTLRYPISASGASTELPAPTASAFLQWNATADALVNAVIPDPSTLIKATSAEAQAGVEDTHFMTPAKTAEAINALSPALTKASQSVAEAATNDTAYMTPLQVKNQVQKSGAVSIPSNNIDFSNEKITFFATTATAQSIPNATDTKIAYGTEAFDVGGYYDPTTYRFSPLISGKYSVTASIDFPSPDATNQYGSIYIFKNGSPVLRFNRNEKAGGANDFCLSVNGIVSMNGTTDYLEVFVYQSNTSASAKSLDTNATINYFGAFKVA